MEGLKLRNAGKRRLESSTETHAFHTEKDKTSDSVDEKLYQSAPGTKVALIALLISRLGSALLCGVSDCDETYNYWEPTHFLLYGKGMQTWEYDPKYALRSYLYLLVHAGPAWLISQLVQPSRLLVFYLTRCLLGSVCASCEVYFYGGVVRQFGSNTGRIVLWLLVLSAGMFISSTAYLPSTSSLYLTLLAVGAWFRQDYKIAIFCTALSTILSWPFTALLGLPIAVDLLLVRGQWRVFVVWSVASAFVILGPVLVCDSFYYGKPVFASLNIVMYNVFTEHGPDLYGTEPASFYLLNGLINFNIMFPAALVSLPFIFVASVVCGLGVLPTRGRHLHIVLAQSGLYLWLAVFWTRPHKEERFLFPVYPLILLAAAQSVDTSQRLFHHLTDRPGPAYARTTSWLSTILLLVFGLLSASRITALYQHYHGSIDVWTSVAQLPATHQQPSTICVGKEWHRFPSSFFLPDNSYTLGFLQSEFRGQLPKYYALSISGSLPTTLTHSDFNDLNQEEPSRYVAHPGMCDYIVDLDNDEVTNLQPRYGANAINWTVVGQFPYLHSTASHPLLRAFYVPLLDEEFCKYNNYLLLKRVINQL